MIKRSEFIKYDCNIIDLEKNVFLEKNCSHKMLI